MLRMLLLLFALFVGSKAEAAPKTVVIALGDIVDSSGERGAKPLRQLVQKLKAEPGKRYFRLIWGSSFYALNYSATALYDRKSRTLKFYSKVFSNDADEKSSGQIQYWMFGGVTQTMLSKLERKYRSEPSDSDGTAFFSKLNFYGAKRRDLGSRPMLVD